MIKTGVNVQRVCQKNGEKIVVATANGKEFETRGDELLMATGRTQHEGLRA